MPLSMSIVSVNFAQNDKLLFIVHFILIKFDLFLPEKKNERRNDNLTLDFDFTNSKMIRKDFLILERVCVQN